MTDQVHLLFSYGTLGDPRIQKALFGRVLACQNGWIEGWGLFLGEAGYLFVKPEAQSRVRGVVLNLNDSDLKAADLWEDRDVYDRETFLVCLEGGSRETAWLYTRRKAHGKPLDGEAVHPRSDSSILADIKLIRQLQKTPD